MSSRLAAVLAGLLALSALAGCGDDDALDSADPTTTAATASTTTTTTTGGGGSVAPVPDGALTVEMVSQSPVPAGAHVWRLELANTADQPVTVTFPTSQRGDVVLRRDGEEVHRWSSGRFFAQQVTEETLEPGGTLAIELDDDLSGVAPGVYDAVAGVSTVDAPEPATVSLRVVAP